MKQKKLHVVQRFINKLTLYSIAGTAITLLTACNTIHEIDRTDKAVLAQEGTVGFVRPDKYSFALFGSNSISEHIEIIYENLTQNDAGFPQVELGLRNKGGQKFWDTEAWTLNLSVKTSFYKTSIKHSGPTSAPVYETNWQPLRILKGEQVNYQAICPIKGAKYYQIRLSESL